MGLLTSPSQLLCMSLLLFVSTILAQNITAQDAKTCGGISNLKQCGISLPLDFCCPTATACMPINSTGIIAAICCPKGEDCSFIQPISCDVNQYNATLHPDNQVHFSDTKDITLPTCGSSCCPLGYKCQSGMCSAETATPSSTSSLELPTSSPTGAPPAAQTQAASAPPAIQPTEQGFNGRSFAAGLFPGLVIGALGTLGLIWIIKRRRESQAKNRFSGDFGHVARTISDPIYDPIHSNRTDFIRSNSRSTRGQPSPKSTTGMINNKEQNSGGMTPKLKSIWERTPKLGFGGFVSTTTTTITGGSSKPALGTTVTKPPPAVRAGRHRDPYTTPNQTPASYRSSTRSRSRSTNSRTPHSSKPKSSKENRPTASRSISTETIDVLMPAPSFLVPPKAPAMREKRMTTASVGTTFTGLMERAGYEEGRREEVRKLSEGYGRAR